MMERMWGGNRLTYNSIRSFAHISSIRTAQCTHFDNGLVLENIEKITRFQNRRKKAFEISKYSTKKNVSPFEGSV